MDLVHRDDIRQLIGRRQGPCISIYMPAFRAGADTLQNPVRFKNQLREAERKLTELDLRPAEVRDMLAPLRALTDDYPFWQFQSDGLALFRSPDLHRYFRVPQRFDELVVVSGRFHLKPLVQLLAWGNSFYVLCLSSNAVRLLECTRFAADEVALPEAVPRSLAEFTGEGAAESQLQAHSVGQGPGGGQVGIFHGHEAKDNKEKLSRFFREIDRGVRSVLKDEKAPMVLAGVDYLFPIYRSVSTYPNVVSEGIKGNVEALRPDELHQKAIDVVVPLFAAEEDQAFAAYRQRFSDNKAIRDVNDIVRAAHHGRIDTLFVGVGVQRWGRYDPAADKVEMREEPAGGDEDLLDLAAADTILNGGTVYAVAPQRMPDGTEAAAILRY